MIPLFPLQIEIWVCYNEATDPAENWELYKGANVCVEKRASHAGASVRRECSLTVPASGMQKLVMPGSVLGIV